MTGRSPLSKPAGPPETLADALTSGPLALAAGLRCANEIAVELRDLHQQNRAYGKLSVNHVIMAESGAQLAPLRSYWDETIQQRDVQAFGAVFYEILTGTPPPVNPSATDPRIQGLAGGGLACTVFRDPAGAQMPDVQGHKGDHAAGGDRGPAARHHASTA